MRASRFLAVLLAAVALFSIATVTPASAASSSPGATPLKYSSVGLATYASWFTGRTALLAPIISDLQDDIAVYDYSSASYDSKRLYSWANTGISWIARHPARYYYAASAAKIRSAL